MTTKRSWVTLCAIAAVVLVVGGFVVAKGYDYVSGDSIHTIGGMKKLAPCHPLPDLRLEELKTSAPATCDLAGAKIRVSSDVVLTAPEFGTNIISDDTPDGTSWGVVNLGGELGVVVYQDDRQWGNSKAVRLVQQAGWHT